MNSEKIIGKIIPRWMRMWDLDEEVKHICHAGLSEVHSSIHDKLPEMIGSRPNTGILFNVERTFLDFRIRATK